jgi:hypothetical protein
VRRASVDLGGGGRGGSAPVRGGRRESLLQQVQRRAGMEGRWYGSSVRSCRSDPSFFSLFSSRPRSLLM